MDDYCLSGSAAPQAEPQADAGAFFGSAAPQAEAGVSFGSAAPQDEPVTAKATTFFKDSRMGKTSFYFGNPVPYESILSHLQTIEKYALFYRLVT
jgi:hypothetical protein